MHSFLWLVLWTHQAPVSTSTLSGKQRECVYRSLRGEKQSPVKVAWWLSLNCSDLFFTFSCKRTTEYPRINLTYTHPVPLQILPGRLKGKLDYHLGCCVCSDVSQYVFLILVSANERSGGGTVSFYCYQQRKWERYGGQQKCQQNTLHSGSGRNVTFEVL